MHALVAAFAFLVGLPTIAAANEQHTDCMASSTRFDPSYAECLLDHRDEHGVLAKLRHVFAVRNFDMQMYGGLLLKYSAVLAERGDLPTARRIWRESIVHMYGVRELNPSLYGTDRSTYNGRVFILRGRYQNGLADFEEYAKLNPVGQESNYLYDDNRLLSDSIVRALHIGSNGRYRSCAEALDHLSDDKLEIWRYLFAGSCWQAAGNQKRARGDWLRALLAIFKPQPFDESVDTAELLYHFSR